MITRNILILGLFLGLPLVAAAQEPTLSGVSESIKTQLEQSLKELDELRQGILSEKQPMMRQLSELEEELSKVRARGREVTREVDDAELQRANLQKRIDQRKEEASYINGLLRDYADDLKALVHLAEKDSYTKPLTDVVLVADNESLDPAERSTGLVEALAISFDRIEANVGGRILSGKAIDPATSAVRPGKFLLLGPFGLFRSEDATQVGMVDVGGRAIEPASLAFPTEEQAKEAADLIHAGTGFMPFDATLGQAHRLAETEETFVEHVKKGGYVMIPILGMAALALLIAIYKWSVMAFVGRPSRRAVDQLLQTVAEGEESEARAQAASLKGPMGRMLQAGVAQLGQPKALIEEVMYERTLTARMHLQRALPFIAICAASAPLLGLLGTVSGIINTFKQMMIDGGADAASVSGGISEALITTKFGLIVAIPSLLLHAFLSRKARGVIGQMEIVAVSFLNHVARMPSNAGRASAEVEADADQVRHHVNEILTEMLGPLANEGVGPAKA